MKQTYGQSLAYFRNLEGKSTAEIAAVLNVPVEEIIAHENDALEPTLKRHGDYCDVINICHYQPFEHCFEIVSA